MTHDERRQEESRPVSETRALVAPVATTAAAPRPRHRQAPFLAQLIATRQQLPQTRARRRAEPAEAVRAYRATAELAKRG